MNGNSSLELHRTLLHKIRAKRDELKQFVQAVEPRSTRLTNMAIVCGAVSAALTAAPALGGQSLTVWMTKTFGLTTPIWQLLCLGAMGCSIAATIATNMAKSSETTTKLIQAQACDAKLEGLETLLELQKVDIGEASEQYARALSEIPFL